ncbi:TetR/AcrR family transcriptional regulator [Methyloferula stellata]|jgi:AcrR family transcriptional regulator|uniref:TetR/AcrR family transcriptional regulator n=1 Tax=Methyloferula stellata TaxID=876270 RepID=UPI0003763C2B|nr:TetR/AcrR family transcriptional regulator [Methyloferula stellata]
MASISTKDPELPTPSSLDDDKARQILDGARRVFLAQGFDGASMNDIARAAGVSKGTIYFHFDSKEALFEALIRAERQQQVEQCWAIDEDSADIAGALTELGRSLLTMMMTPEIIAQVRTVIAVAAKFPRIGRAFYETGPKHGFGRLSAYFARQTEAGRLEAPEPDTAAIHFIQLCLGDIHKRLMFCPDDKISDAEVEHTVGAAVSVFMRAYGPRR